MYQVRNQVEGVADGTAAAAAAEDDVAAFPAARVAAAATPAAKRKSVAAWKTVLRQVEAQAEQRQRLRQHRPVRFAVLMLPQDLDALMGSEEWAGGGGKMERLRVCGSEAAGDRSWRSPWGDLQDGSWRIAQGFAPAQHGTASNMQLQQLQLATILF